MAPGLLRDGSSIREYSWSNASGNSVAPSPIDSQDMDASPRPYDEPLAIVGMGFRLPQEASTEEGLWKILMDKRNTMTEYPKDRVNIDSFYHPDRSRSDTLNFRGGHFLDEYPSGFDAPFFSITAAEAEAMDPQQRLVLETAFHALENAGIPLDRVAGSKTSVHAGSFSDDYRTIELREPENYPSYACSGIAQTMLSNRVSWFFNLQGASVTVDTACSSSMTALDISCQGLRSHEADMGLVVGSNLLLGLELSLTLSNMNFLSPDSKCYSFDHRANGYGRGEGVGVLVIKRLSSALEAGDTVRAVIRATGSGQDGWTPGITQPSVTAQEKLMTDTYAKLGLDMGITRYVEAHGTGTAVGDPIEATAIGNAFKQYRTSAAPMYIGSIKSNLGHLEGCSGLAGVIKTVLMLEKGTLAPNANFEKLNPAIDVARLNIQIVTEPIPWPTRGIRRASVSSFGIGGANVHVVLDDAYNYLRLHGLQGNHCTVPTPPSRENVNGFSNPPVPDLHSPPEATKPDRSKKLLIFSAADQDGIGRIAAAYGEFARRLSHTSGTTEEAVYLDNMAYTLFRRRSTLNWRSFAVVESLQDVARLASIISKPIKRLTTTKLAYAFTGQGAQYAKMAEGLLQSPVFLNSLRRSEMYFDHFGSSWSLFDELLRPSASTRINEPLLSQPLCTAIQIGIVDLLQHFGLSPSAVLGHSSGEIAAAYAIGAIAHESATKIAYFRGLCADELLHADPSSSTSSGMMSVGLSYDDVGPYLARLSSELGTTEVVVACLNSPSNVTLSGNVQQLDWLKDLFDQSNIFARKLRVTIAYHSPQMQKVAGKYLQLLGCLKPGHGRVTYPPMISSVTGDVVPVEDLQRGQYWVDNMVLPVRFSDAVATAYNLNTSSSKSKASVRRAAFNDILEIGPHSTLRGPILETLRSCGGSTVTYFSALNRSASGEDTIFELAGNLFSRGYQVLISAMNDGQGLKMKNQVALPHLPKYPFDHSRHYWHETRSGKEGYRLRKHPRLDLLGTPCPNWNPLEPRWTCYLRVSEQPWIADHKIKGSVLYPASGMIEMALEAAKQMVPDGRQVSGYVVKETTFMRPIIIPADSEKREVEIVLKSSKTASHKYAMNWDFSIYALEADGAWQEKCNGIVSSQYERPLDSVDNGKEARARRHEDKLSLESIQRSCITSVNPQEFYRVLEGKDFIYGPHFQAISNIYADGKDKAYADINSFQWPSGKEDFRQDHIVHPTTLDAMVQTCFVAGARGNLLDVPAMLPSRLNHLWIRREGVSHPDLDSTRICMHTRSTQHKFMNEAFVVEPSTGVTVLSMDFECVLIDQSDNEEPGSRAVDTLCHELQWRPDIDLMDTMTLSSYCNAARLERVTDVDYLENTDLLVMAYLIDIVQSVPQSRLATIPPALQRYLDWASDCQKRFEQGSLSNCTPSNELWQDISTDTEVRNDMMEKLRHKSDLGYLFAEVARNLPAVLNGDIDAVEFMFHDDKLEKFYRAINDQIVCFEPLGRFFDLLTHQTPSLKILEIGAGTGGSTIRLLDMLESTVGCPPSLARYDYTDISPAFFDKAAEVFAKHSSYMDFRIFDVERDPVDQGFEEGTYDVVFAANVLHATRNLDNTLRDARRLLKPGGRLILLEIVEETIRVGFAFGLFPSWWSGEEQERRLRPWLRTPDWHKAMQRNGFSGIDLEIPDFENEAHHEFSLLVATAVETPDSGIAVPSISLVIDGESHIQEMAGEALKIELAERGHACNIQRLHRFADLDVVKEGHWINLCELDRPILSDLDQPGFDTLKRLILSARTVFWVTGGGGDSETDPRFHVVDGLVRTIGTESPNLEFAALALEPQASDPVSLAKKIYNVFRAMLERGGSEIEESEYAERQNLICTHRVVPSPGQQEEVSSRKRTARNVHAPFGSHPALALAIGSTGLLDTLHFTEDPEHFKPLPPGTVEVKIDTGGVNFRDCLTALGQLEADYIGCEYAGVVSRIPDPDPDSAATPTHPFRPGDRVAGWCKGSYQTYTRNPVELVTRVPDGVSLAEAAASLVVFSTAWHSLVNVGRLARGESVLIHSAAGGTGQAAIQVARHLGAEVYVTAGSVEKKRFLMETYGIGEDRVFASRDLSFAGGLLRATGGRGVDVVLNSLSGESLLASWECIATCGRFVEIGNRDIMEHGQLPMWPFRKAASFTHVALYVMVDEQPALLMEVGRIVLELLANKTFFVPQPLKVFGISEVQDIFRIFQSGNHYGRMVVQMRPDEIVEARVKPGERYRFDASRTYLVTGGLGGLGRSIALWLVERGARNLILLSRSGARTEPAQELLRHLSEVHVDARAPECDICDKAALSRVIAECAKDLPPIAGCIQAAMVLRDVLFENMSYDAWTTACRPKIQGSWNLHSVLPAGLDFFTCLSSISCIVGNFGQANYAAGNSYMDELVRYRTLRGERATAINLGWVEKEGTVAERNDLKVTFAKIESTPPISMEELYAILDFACDPEKPISPHQLITGLAPPKRASQDSIALEVPWLQKPSFRPFIHAAIHASEHGRQTTTGSETDFATRFICASTPEEAVQAVCQCMRSRLSKALATSDDEIDMTLPLHAIGVDSLFGIELKNFLAKRFDADIAVFDLMGASNAEAACTMIANRSKLQAKK